MPGTVCFFAKCKNNSIKNPELYFVPFVKPHNDMARCKEWIKLCGRFIPPDKITRNTHVCDEHFNTNEVLDSRSNSTLKPIPKYRLEKVELVDVPPALIQGAPILDQVKQTYSKPHTKLEKTIAKNLNQLEKIKDLLLDDQLKNVIGEIIQDFNTTKRFVCMY